jgi:hypothetical protein
MIESSGSGERGPPRARSAQHRPRAKESARGRALRVAGPWGQRIGRNRILPREAQHGHEPDDLPRMRSCDLPQKESTKRHSGPRGPAIWTKPEPAVRSASRCSELPALGGRIEPASQRSQDYWPAATDLREVQRSHGREPPTCEESHWAGPIAKLLELLR